MNGRLASAVALLVLSSTGAWASPSAAPAPAQTASPADVNRRAETYFNLTMGHLYEQAYEESSQAADADRAIDFYKKAYALDPSSGVIGEQLAEMYFSRSAPPKR